MTQKYVTLDIKQQYILSNIEHKMNHFPIPCINILEFLYRMLTKLYGGLHVKVA